MERGKGGRAKGRSKVEHYEWEGFSESRRVRKGRGRGKAWKRKDGTKEIWETEDKVKDKVRKH